MTVIENPNRNCGHCGTQYAKQADTETERVYSCEHGCGAYETVFKGKNSWWYHGTKLPEDMSASYLESRAALFDKARP